jgi:hypothetical protein
MHKIDQQLNLMIRGRFDEGWKISEILHEENPEDLRHLFNRGWFLINKGDLQAGFQCLESGRFLNVYGSGKLTTDKPIWNPETCPIESKIIIINMEAGFGDQIIYARFANEIKKRGGTAIICCDVRLHSLFSRIPGVSKCITISEVSSTLHDYWVPSFSCSWIFGHNFDTLPNEPYIFPNDEFTDKWKSIINSDKIKVGIRWSGNPKFEHQQFRIFSSDYLIQLHKYTGIQFYSLQRDHDVIELPDEIIDLQHQLETWDDTTSAIQELDLVITSCTSIAHLSAAMGKPTWVIVPILPYHIWAYGGDHSPWYQKTTRVFRQKTFGDWKETFTLLEDELVNYFKLIKK